MNGLEGILYIILIFLVSKRAIKLKSAGMLISIIYLLPTAIGGLQGDLVIKQILDGILNVICIFSIFSVIGYYSAKGRMPQIMDKLYACNLFACIISFVSLFIKGRPLDTDGTAINYFFGNKFSTNYLFIMLVGLYYLKTYSYRSATPKRRSILFGMIIMELFVSYWTKCSTTLVGGVALVLVILFTGKLTQKAQKLFSSPIVGVSCFIIPGLVAMYLPYFLRINWIHNLVVNVLHKSVGLTGRAFIYSKLMSIFLDKPIWGYGYNSKIVNNITRVGNAQNGLFQILIDYGVIGVLSLSFLIFAAFRASKESASFWGIKVVYLTLCICSIVEISINYYFYLSVALLLFSESYEFQKKNVIEDTHHSKN